MSTSDSPDNESCVSASTDLILVGVDNRIATLTLNRPESRNAMSTALLRDLWNAAKAAQADDDVDVLIVTGADPTFCAGLDLKELGAGAGALLGAAGVPTDTPETGTPKADTPESDSARPETRRPGPLPRGPKPVIGAINGAAITGGFELALACDFLVASNRARFADTHARVGIQPGWGLTVLLPQAIGLRRAREMSATGNFLDAQTALDWGVVNHVVSHDELIGFTRGLAADIASNDQRAVRRIFATYDAGSRVDVDGAWQVEAQASREWSSDGIDSDQIEQRRRAVVERGRDQLG